MMGAAGLKGPGGAAVFARQRLNMASRSTRSISTFRPQRFQTPGQKSQLTLNSSGIASWRSASTAVGPAAVRFNSTSNTTPAPSPETNAPADVSDIGFDISQIPEKIGYLKELGLDYGWGTSSMVQYAVEHLHMWTGLPWWASIVGVGLAIRVALLKSMIDASDNGARMHNSRPLLDPLRREMMVAQKNGETAKFQMKRLEMSKLHSDYGIKPWKSFVPMLQIPFGYGVFRVVRGMTSLPVPALLDESILWLNDLTVSDPLYILPAISGACMYLTFKKGGETGTMDIMKTSAGKAMLFGLPAISFAFMAFMPSALQLYFSTTAIFAVFQSYAINNVAFREKLGMAVPINHQGKKEAKSNLERLQDRVAGIEDKEIQAQSAGSGSQKTSKFDQIYDNAAKWGKQAKLDLNEKLREASGQVTKNADGSPVAAPRLTAAEKREAELYEANAKAREIYAREERNHARRSGQMRTLANERRKAEESLKRYQAARK
ncbi:hypothetical protein N7462_003723 [Penicillium macrosclerotiorum]|uniref:uncharacterized protein n=1 Tax=Penicillium macrosclerotiorum TaxID=303699 RepID=UPI002546B57B|nr:uncharacterized protein N7462_003723 [Penicillium macrosclerotiorum]KAJ5689331.1 hypothetical protein N7462_003723 [Penicillium macrosclerotiorum]